MKRLLIYYTLSALGVTFILSVTVLSHQYTASLAKTLSQFQALKINNVKMKGAIKEIEKTTARIDLLIPANYKTEEMEERILTAIDSIKTRMKGVNITLGTFDRKANELALPIALTGTIDDYAMFVNEISYLQSIVSPVMFIDNVSIAKGTSETRGEVSFEIKGAMKITSHPKGGKL
ncbi:MAG: hypothetical protein NTV58_19260 [Deltaproteobacteria bacterium]|nr:hypothetical protein [Deltaproteobacteria bacterium]